MSYILVITCTEINTNVYFYHITLYIRLFITLYRALQLKAVVVQFVGVVPEEVGVVNQASICWDGETL